VHCSSSFVVSLAWLSLVLCLQNNILITASTVFSFTVFKLHEVACSQSVIFFSFSVLKFLVKYVLECSIFHIF